MRLNCNVEVSNRSLLSYCSRPKQKASRASLVIGYPSGMPKEREHLHIVICTAKNKGGSKYKVKANVEQLYEKFVNEGRATIRFRSPPHDLLLSQADLLQLKSFLKLLRLCLSDGDNGKLSLTRLSATSTVQLQPPKTKVEIENRSGYSKSSSFPSSLNILRVVYCGVTRIEEKILRLHQLRVLDLSHNDIEDLPSMIGLPNLEQLNLAHNRLKRLPAEAWTNSLSRCLHTLDLSHNDINEIPSDICKLTKLEILKLHNNQLSDLPFNLSNLRSLKHLSVANNSLSILPGGIAALQFESIDVSGNPFCVVQPPGDILADMECPSLLEWAARSVLKSRLTMEEGDLPTHLIDYLSNWKRCICGRLFVASGLRSVTMIDLHKIAHTVVHSYDSSVPISSISCCMACLCHITRKT